MKLRRIQSSSHDMLWYTLIYLLFFVKAHLIMALANENALFAEYKFPRIQFQWKLQCVHTHTFYRSKVRKALPNFMLCILYVDLDFARRLHDDDEAFFLHLFFAFFCVTDFTPFNTRKIWCVISFSFVLRIFILRSKNSIRFLKYFDFHKYSLNIGWRDSFFFLCSLPISVSTYVRVSVCEYEIGWKGITFLMWICCVRQFIRSYSFLYADFSVGV